MILGKSLSFVKIINIALLTGLFLSLILLSWAIDYRFLIDPKYYFEAISLSSSIESALLAGHRWSVDVGFILFSFIINQLLFIVNLESISSYNYQLVSASVVSVLLIVAYISLMKFHNYRFLFVTALMLVVSPSFVGALFNIWRQGFAEFLILLFIAFYNVKFFRFVFSFLACSFHLNTAALFLSVFFSKFIIKNLYYFVIVYFVFALIIYLFFGYLFEQYQALEVYANTNSKLPWIRLLFCVCTFIVPLVVFLTFRLDKKSVSTVSSICNDGVFRVAFFGVSLVILVGFVFALVMPAASERIMHYYFILFPILNLLIYEKSNALGRLLIVFFSFFYLAANFFIVMNSQTWLNVRFMVI